MLGFSLVSGELLCPQLWSNIFPMIFELFHFNCYHDYTFHTSRGGEDGLSQHLTFVAMPTGSCPPDSRAVALSHPVWPPRPHSSSTCPSLTHSLYPVSAQMSKPRNRLLRGATQGPEATYHLNVTLRKGKLRKTTPCPHVTRKYLDCRDTDRRNTYLDRSETDRRNTY